MHFKGQEEFVSRMLDLDERAYRQRSVIFTPFLNASEQDVLSRLPLTCSLYFSAGYEQGESKRCAFSYDEIEPIFPIALLKGTYDARYHSIQHFDVLGAFMNVGLNRDVIGDIIVEEGCVYLVVDESVSAYIVAQLQQIKRASITLQRCESIPPANIRVEYEEYTISSLRLDVVVAAITRQSRDQGKALIRASHVKVNQVILVEYDQLCNNNSTISIRKYGRFTLEDTGRVTKKGRCVVRVGKYI